MGFWKRHRLPGPLYREVLRQGKRIRQGDLVIALRPNALGYPRLGLGVSKRVGKAVVRNRWKRLVREAFRLKVATRPVSHDMVVMVRGRRGTEGRKEKGRGRTRSRVGRLKMQEIARHLVSGLERARVLV